MFRFVASMYGTALQSEKSAEASLVMLYLVIVWDWSRLSLHSITLKMEMRQGCLRALMLVVAGEEAQD